MSDMELNGHRVTTVEEPPTPEVKPTPICADCGNPFPHLHRHHILPKVEGGTDDESNLIRVCPNCHALRHGGWFGGPKLRGKGRKPKVEHKPVALSDQEFPPAEKPTKRPSYPPAGFRHLWVTLPSAHCSLLEMTARMGGEKLSVILSRILDETFYGPPDDSSLSQRQIRRYNGAIEEVKRVTRPLFTMLQVLLCEDPERDVWAEDAPTDPPVIVKGLRFSVEEWLAVKDLMQASEKDFADTIRVALGTYAKARGTTFPAQPSQKAS